MTQGFAIQSTIEIILAVLFIWGLFHEEKLARLERRIFAKVFAGLKSRRPKLAAKQADR